MIKRKPNNNRARMQRSMAAVLRTNAVAVINLDPSGRQGMINYRNCKSVPPGRHVANAVCDIAHRWTIYLAGLCIDQNGHRYIKAQEVAPDGIYLADHLTEVIETCYRALLDTCNPLQLAASGWIAVPDQVSLDEEHAARIFEACGAWAQHNHHQTIEARTHEQ